MLRDRQLMVLNLLHGQHPGDSPHHNEQEHQERRHFFSIPQKL